MLACSIVAHRSAATARSRSRRTSRSARVARTACQVLTATASTSSSTNAGGRRQDLLVPAGQLPQPIAGRGRAGLHRLVRQVALEVAGEAVGRLVAAAAVLLQRLHHDPVQLAAHQSGQPGRLGLPLGRRVARAGPDRAQPRARLRRLLLADDPQQLVEGRLLQPLWLEGRRAGQQLVEQHAQRSRCRCACRRPGRSARPARGSCTPACRRLRRTR